MSVALKEKPKRRELAPPKGKAMVAPERARTLTAEEIDRLTEPERRRRSSEICKELVKMIRQREEAAQS